MSDADPEQYDRLEMYGFGLDYPSSFQIELSPPSNREHGDLVLKAPSGPKFFLSWGELSRIKKFKDATDHADYNISRLAKARESSVRDVRHQAIVVNGHPACLSDVKVDLVRRGVLMNKTVASQEASSVHVYCEASSRYFIIYGSSTADKSQGLAGIVSRMADTFSCHRPDG